MAGSRAHVPVQFLNKHPNEQQCIVQTDLSLKAYSILICHLVPPLLFLLASPWGGRGNKSYASVSLPQLFYFVGFLQSPLTSGLLPISFYYPISVVLVREI